MLLLPVPLFLSHAARGDGFHPGGAGPERRGHTPDDVGGVTLQLEVMDPGNVGMVQTGGQPGLPLKGLQVGRVISDRLIDDFDGHHPVQHGVPGPVDGPLATSGYPFQDFVSAYSLEHSVLLQIIEA